MLHFLSDWFPEEQDFFSLLWKIGSLEVDRAASDFMIIWKHNIIVKSFHNCFKLDMFWLLRPLTGNIYIHNFQGHLKCLIWTIDNPNRMQNMFCICYLVLLIDVRCKEGWLPLAWYICASLLQLLQPIWWEPRLQKRRILMITITTMSRLQSWSWPYSVMCVKYDIYDDCYVSAA